MADTGVVDVTFIGIMFALFSIAGILLAYMTYEGYQDKNTFKVWGCAAMSILAFFEAGRLAIGLLTGDIP